jgi:uncharacterized protein (DUF1778 family)
MVLSFGVDVLLRCVYNVAMARDEILRIRLTEAERRALEAAAKRAGQTLSGYVRWVALRELEETL